MCGRASQCALEESMTRSAITMAASMLPRYLLIILKRRKYVRDIRKEKKMTTPVSPDARWMAAIITSESHVWDSQGKGGVLKEKMSFFGTERVSITKSPTRMFQHVSPSIRSLPPLKSESMIKMAMNRTSATGGA